MPPTTGGSTSGTITSTRNRRRGTGFQVSDDASTQASGTPNTMHRPVAMAAGIQSSPGPPSGRLEARIGEDLSGVIGQQEREEGLGGIGCPGWLDRDDRVVGGHLLLVGELDALDVVAGRDHVGAVDEAG